MECHRPGGHRDEDVPVRDTLGPEELGGVDDARRRTRDVVVVGRHEAPDARRSPRHRGVPACSAGPGDPGDDLGDPLEDDATAGDVVRHEHRAGADDDDVVDDHADEVLPDRVVDVEARAIAIFVPTPSVDVASRGCFIPSRAEGVDHPREAAGRTEDRPVMGPRNGVLHEFDGTVSRCGVDSGGCVVEGGGVAHCCSWILRGGAFEDGRWDAPMRVEDGPSQATRAMHPASR